MKLFKRKPLHRYFAYGSNMFQHRLECRVGKITKVGAAYLSNYSLVFDYGNENESFANIIDKQNDVVFGVVYLLTKKQLQILDYYEGAVVDPHKYYHRVCDLIQNQPTYFYISENRRPEFEKPLSDFYKYLLIEGYKQNNKKPPQKLINAETINILNFANT